MAENPKLAALLQASRQENIGNIVWQPDIKRVNNVILKLARGHIAYELSVPHIEQPEQLTFIPLTIMSDEQRRAFENPIGNNSVRLPEIGSRSFMRTIAGGQECYQENGWNIVQDGNYRYLVSQSEGDFVQIVIGEYLACRVIWKF